MKRLVKNVVVVGTMVVLFQQVAVASYRPSYSSGELFHIYSGNQHVTIPLSAAFESGRIVSFWQKTKQNRLAAFEKDVAPAIVPLFAQCLMRLHAERVMAERAGRLPNYAPIERAISARQTPLLLEAAYYFNVRPLVVLLYTKKRSALPKQLIQKFALKRWAFSVQELLEVDAFPPVVAALLDASDRQIGSLVGIDLLRNRDRITELDLSDNYLEHVELWQLAGLSHLEELRLNNNRLHTIPSRAFGAFKQIKILDLSGNVIAKIDELAFVGCTQLKRLLLCDNALSAVPAALSHHDLASLEVLELSGNKLVQLSNNAFFALTSLTHLSLESNRIVRISPYAFSGLGDLVWLDLSSNRIQYLDFAFFNPLKKLLRLDLVGNTITVLHGSIAANLAQLKTLHLEGNPIKEIDSTVFYATSNLEVDIAYRDKRYTDTTLLQKELKKQELNSAADFGWPARE